MEPRDVRQLGLKFFVVGALLLGVFFRFFNIDRQLYWNDEVFTSLRVAGYQRADLKEDVFSGRWFSAAEMQRYQTPNPQKTTADTVRGLALEEPQHVPLYFVMARYWVQCFGNSTTAIRSLSAVMSILAFPCLYWLCRELFGSPQVGWIAMALFALSPFQVVYAQEARPYSMFILMALLSSASLLRAMRVNTHASWAFYATAVILAVYTQILFAVVALGHALYVFIMTRFGRPSLSYVIASLAAFLTFIPWLVILMTNSSEGGDWTREQESLIAVLVRWSGIVSRTFVDLGIGPGSSFAAKIAVLPFVGIVLLLAMYSVYFMIRRAPRREWLFVVILIASAALPLFLFDVTLGRRLGTTRYILSSCIGLQLALAYLFSTQIQAVATPLWRRRLWQAVTVMFILGGGISCAVRSQSEVWWNKVPDKYGDFPQIARIVNQAR